jgi:hypothetical protein
MKTYSATIYFLGDFKPAHYEAKTIKKLHEQMLNSIVHMSQDDWQFFAPRITEGCKQLRKLSCTGFSAEYGSRGVSFKKRAHDPFLDAITAKLPTFDGIDYRFAIN